MSIVNNLMCHKTFVPSSQVPRDQYQKSCLCRISPVREVSYHADFFEASMRRACHESAMSIVMKSMTRGKMVLK